MKLIKLFSLLLKISYKQNDVFFLSEPHEGEHLTADVVCRCNNVQPRLPLSFIFKKTKQYVTKYLIVERFVDKEINKRKICRSQLNPRK